MKYGIFIIPKPLGEFMDKSVRVSEIISQSADPVLYIIIVFSL